MKKLSIFCSLLADDFLPFYEVISNDQGNHIKNSLLLNQELETLANLNLKDIENFNKFSEIISNSFQLDDMNIIFSSNSHYFINEWRQFARINEINLTFIVVWRHPLEKEITDANLAVKNCYFLKQFIYLSAQKKDILSFHADDHCILKEEFNPLLNNLLGFHLNISPMLPASITSCFIKQSLPPLPSEIIPLELEALNTLWGINRFGTRILVDESAEEYNHINFIDLENGAVGLFLRGAFNSTLCDKAHIKIETSEKQNLLALKNNLQTLTTENKKLREEINLLSSKIKENNSITKNLFTQQTTIHVEPVGVENLNTTNLKTPNSTPKVSFKFLGKKYKLKPWAANLLLKITPHRVRIKLQS